MKVLEPFLIFRSIKMLKILLVTSTMLLTGCFTVVDRDFEAEEREYIKQHAAAAKDPLYGAPTPDTVVAATEDGVSVLMYKAAPEKRSGMDLQVWRSSIYNKNDYPVCVMVQWKLMDFEMISDYPDFSFIDAKSTMVNYATMRQQIWNLDGTAFALPPSGYVEKLIIREPNMNAKNKERCTFNDEEVETL
jgi:hypothetical protein